jgi:hypothetical protein
VYVCTLLYYVVLFTIFALIWRADARELAGQIAQLHLGLGRGCAFTSAQASVNV